MIIGVFAATQKQKREFYISLSTICKTVIMMITLLS